MTFPPYRTHGVVTVNLDQWNKLLNKMDAQTEMLSEELAALRIAIKDYSMNLQTVLMILTSLNQHKKSDDV